MKALVHDRKFSIKTYDLGKQRLLIEGRLLDQRYRSRDNEDEELPKVIHHMVVRLTVRGAELLIEEAEAEMIRHPREECPVVLPWIRKLEGLKIAKGFTSKVKEIVGDTQGCAHLTSLVLSMGPSAVQGYWAAYGVEREKISLRDEAVKKVINTCYVWREDGPLVKELKGS
jgi:hypothetical protein